MSISSRIQAMGQHLEDDYSVLELAGADLTNVDKNIINLKPTWKERLLYFMNNGTDVVWNNWDKVIGEGTSLSLNNTLEGKMKIDLKGNSSQDDTPTPSSPVAVNVVTGDNTIEVTGKNLLSPNTNKNATSSNGITYTPVYDGGLLQYVNVNGTASADSSYLIQNASRYDIDNTKSYIFNGCPSGGSSGTYSVVIYYYDENNGYLGGVYDTGTGRTIPTASKILTNIYIKSGQTINNLKFYPMLRLSTITDTTYEPYQSQSYNVNLGNLELCKIGDYQDYIYKHSGKWYVKKEIGKRTYTGASSEVWTMAQNGQSLNYFYVGTENEKINGYGNMFCNILPVISGSSWNISTYQNLVGGASTNSTVNIMLEDSSINTVALLKTWLGTHNLIVYYVLATPTTTEITDSTLISQLEALSGAKSYNPQTNVSQVNNDLPFILTTTALREMA